MSGVHFLQTHSSRLKILKQRNYLLIALKSFAFLGLWENFNGVVIKESCSSNRAEKEEQLWRILQSFVLEFCFLSVSRMVAQSLTPR